MAKRFKMLAPFDSVTGNVSGAQKLAYPVNGQGAYEGPAGKNYAQNYKPRFIMNERKSDGRLYFQVKQRSATTITPRSKRAMAVLGGCGAIVGAILKDKTSALYQALYEAWLVTKPVSAKTGELLSFRNYLSLSIMGNLRAKNPVISFLWNNDGTPAFIRVNNPYVSGGTASYDVTISDGALVKFWSELANNPVIASIEGLGKCISHADETFNMIIEGNHNVLDLSLEDIDGTKYVKGASQFVVIADAEIAGEYSYATGTLTLSEGNEYYLVTNAPE